jgi:hypothetical protein
MVSGKNYNIVTKSIGTGSTIANAAVVVGDIVPVGMTRYITFLAITPRNGALTINRGRKIYFCSTSTIVKASTVTLASAAAKWKYVQISASADPNVSFPNEIHVENPLFSIAASRYLTVFQISASVGSGAASVFVQYYDQ